ncbi:MAG: AMP-binding protein [Treponema sp.]|nr:AMP-binding protein [Candidatus Treponema equifaecale]
MKKLYLIQNKEPELQLNEFFSHLEKFIPLIVPAGFDTSSLDSLKVPENADFAVASSGTKGKPKLYFRSKESWTDFFPEQNDVFSINSASRIFIHGSLAFTGNLNIAFEAVEANSFLYCSSSLRSEIWSDEILKNQIDTIYLIPDKLLHLVKTGKIFEAVKTIICGSQFISEKLFNLTRRSFPNAKIILYYGASETSYVSYKILEENFVDENCVGKIFDSVKVEISSEGHILVDSPYSVCGISGFFDTKDTGFIKDGLLYLSGRSDDQINILGEKINASEIIKRILQLEDIEECDVKVEEIKSKKTVVAHIAGKNLPDALPESIFEGISMAFIPKKIVRYEKLPRNESGKICIKGF